MDGTLPHCIFENLKPVEISKNHFNITWTSWNVVQIFQIRRFLMIFNICIYKSWIYASVLHEGIADKYFTMSTEFHTHISEWSQDHKKCIDSFIRPVKWPKMAVKVTKCDSQSQLKIEIIFLHFFRLLPKIGSLIIMWIWSVSHFYRVLVLSDSFLFLLGF